MFNAVFMLRSESTTTVNISLEKKRISSEIQSGVKIIEEIDEREAQYFFYSVPQFIRDVTNIQIHSTLLQGSIIILASRIHPHPNLHNYEKIAFTNDLIEFDYEEFGKLDRSVVYLTVYGEGKSRYNLEVLIQTCQDVHHNCNNYESQFVPLSESLPQKIILKKQNQTTYFSLSLGTNSSYINQRPPNVTIVLTPIKGTFDFFLKNSNKEFPNAMNYKWKSQKNAIFFTSSEYSPNNLNFAGAVVVNNLSNFYQDRDSSSIFSIEYYTSYSIFQVYDNSIQKKFIAKDQKQIFHYYYLDQPQLWIYWAKPENYLHQNQFQMKVFFTTLKPIPDLTFSKETIVSIDSTNLTNCQRTSHCYITLVVESYIDMTYHLTIWTQKDKMELFEQVPLISKVPDFKNVPVHVYFYQYDKKNSTLIFGQNTESLSVFANIYKLSEFPQKSQWIFPTQFKHQVQYNIRDLEIVMMPSYFIQNNCSQGQEGCVVCLSIYHTSQDNFNENHTFSINLIRHYYELQEGQPLHQTIGKDQIKYYAFDIVSEKQEIFIRLNVLGLGQTVMFLKRGRDTMPSLENYNFKSNLGLNEEIIVRQDGDNVSLIGEYFLGVQGIQNTKFVLDLQSGDLLINRVQPGQPIQFQLKQYQTHYYVFEHSKNVSLVIVNSLKYGYIETAIITENSYLLNDKQLFPDISNGIYEWTTMLSHEKQQMKILTNDSKYCFRCSYIIQIKAYKSSEGWFAVKTENSYLEFVGDLRFTETLIPHERSLFHFYFSQAQFIITFHSGDSDIDFYIKHDITVSESVYDQHETIPSNSRSTHVQIYAGKQYVNDPHVPHSILVSARDQPVSYTIGFILFNRTRQLLNNIVYTDMLSVNDVKKYQLKVDVNAITSKTVSISLNILKIGYEPSLSLTALNKNLQIRPMQSISFLNSINVEYIVPGGDYEFTVANDNILQTESLYYSIIVSEDLTILQDAHFIYRTLPIGENNKYEIVAPAKKYIMIETIQCKGQVRIFHSQNFDSFNSNYFDTEFPLADQISQTIFLSEGERSFISVMGNSAGFSANGNAAKQTKYLINSRHYSDINQMPYRSFQLQNKSVSIQLMTSSEATIHFSGIKPLGHPKYLVSSVTYKIQISKDVSSLQESILCSIDSTNTVFTQVIKQNHLAPTISYNLTLPFMYNKFYLYISVFAQVELVEPETNNKDYANFKYNTQEFTQWSRIPIPNIGPEITFLFVFLAVLLAISLICLGLFVYRSYKQANSIRTALLSEAQAHDTTAQVANRPTDISITQISQPHQQQIIELGLGDSGIEKKPYQQFNDDQQL